MKTLFPEHVWTNSYPISKFSREENWQISTLHNELATFIEYFLAAKLTCENRRYFYFFVIYWTYSILTIEHRVEAPLVLAVYSIFKFLILRLYGPNKLPLLGQPKRVEIFNLWAKHNWTLILKDKWMTITEQQYKVQLWLGTIIAWTE